MKRLLIRADGLGYAIPKDHDTIAVIYNKAIFDKYGIDYPTGDWTWQDFADIAQEITEKGQADGMFLSGLIGMPCAGSWTIPNYYAVNDVSDYGWVMLPYADRNCDGQCHSEERCSIYNGLGRAAYSDTENPDAAWSLISAFCSEEGQTKQSELGVTMSGYIGSSEPFITAYEGWTFPRF